MTWSLPDFPREARGTFSPRQTSNEGGEIWEPGVREKCWTHTAAVWQSTISRGALRLQSYAQLGAVFSQHAKMPE